MFEQILGNESNKQVLSNIIKNHLSLHSYMFVGQNGIGKKIFAIEFAESILACKKQNNPNLFIIDLGDENIKNSVIKGINETVYEKPINADKKIYIINNAENMTEEAQNSLLKTLEEPPEYVIIILIVKNEAKLLNTIKSRCTKILFNKLSVNNLQDILQINQISVPENILKLADGSAENAIKLKDNLDIYEQILCIFQKLKGINILDFLKVKEQIFTKENANTVLEFINSIFYQKILDNQDVEKHIKCIEITENTKDKLTKNCNFDMTIDSFLFSVWEELN